MRMLVIGQEAKLRHEIKKLEAAGYVAVEVPGAVHLGRNMWIFPVEVTAHALAQESTCASPPAQ